MRTLLAWVVAAAVAALILFLPLQNYYTGIAVLPYDNGTYVQAPFEDCTKEVYEKMMKSLHEINLNDVIESDDNTNLSEQAACAGGACEVTF